MLRKFKNRRGRYVLYESLDKLPPSKKENYENLHNYYTKLLV